MAWRWNLLPSVVMIAVLLVGCSSEDRSADGADQADIADSASPPLEAPMGPVSERLLLGTPEDAVSTILAAWAAGDFHTVALSFDEEARREIARALNDLDLTWLAGAPRHLGLFADEGW